MNFWEQFVKTQLLRREYLWSQAHPFRAWLQSWLWILRHPIQYRRLKKAQRAAVEAARLEITQSMQAVVNAAIDGFQKALLFFEALETLDYFDTLNDPDWEYE